MGNYRSKIYNGGNKVRVDMQNMYILKECPFCHEKHDVEYRGTQLVARVDGKRQNVYHCQYKNRDFVLVEKDKYDNEVIIHPSIGTPCRLWHDDQPLGNIPNELVLNDIRIQIMHRYHDVTDAERDNWGRYWIEYYDADDNNKRYEINIDCNGTLSDYPNGFADDIGSGLIELCGNETMRENTQLFKESCERRGLHTVKAFGDTVIGNL